jgi:hypothetical protein
MENGSFGLSRCRLLAEGFVPIGVKRFSKCFDGGDPMFGEKSFELALDQFHSSDDRGNVSAGRGGLESKFQMVQ